MTETTELERASTRTTEDDHIRRLEELLSEAARLYADAEKMTLSALSRYRASGEAYLAARELCPYGKWHEVVQGYGLNYTTVARLMRLATYWDDLPAEYRAGKIPRRPEQTVVQAALHAVEGKPPTRSYPKRLDSTAEIQSLRDEGASLSEIADIVGASEAGVWRVLYWATVDWVDNPEKSKAADERAKRKLKEQRAARAALKRERERAERDNLAKSASTELGKCYSTLRRLSVDIDRAMSVSNGSIHAELDHTRAYVVRAELHLMKAIREERQTT